MLQGVRVNVDVPAVSMGHENHANKVLDFRNAKVPSFIITVVQVQDKGKLLKKYIVQIINLSFSF